MKAILSIDGGGMRGLIPARFLAALEAEAGLPCSKLFDLMAGTSTGGILALGLARPCAEKFDPDAQPVPVAYTAAQLVELYQKQGQTIFHRPPPYVFESGDGMLASKYPCDGIDQVLDQYFGVTPLSAALTHVMATSYDCSGPNPVEFKSWQPTGGPLMRDVARATSAAPTFFPALPLGPGQLLVDGGMVSNNPTMWALSVLDEVFPNVDPLSSEVIVVSLGAGDTESKIDPGRGGIKDWGPVVVDVLMNASSHLVHLQAQKFCPRYFRFQTALQGASEAMDDASPGTVAFLLKIADDMVAAQGKQIQQLAALLKSRGG